MQNCLNYGKSDIDQPLTLQYFTPRKINAGSSELTLQLLAFECCNFACHVSDDHSPAFDAFMRQSYQFSMQHRNSKWPVATNVATPTRFGTHLEHTEQQ